MGSRSHKITFNLADSLLQNKAEVLLLASFEFLDIYFLSLNFLVPYI